MGIEIERKFLVDVARLPPLPTGSELEQGYLGSDPSVRVRVKRVGSETHTAWLTIKGPGDVEREEYEYAIPAADGEGLLRLAKHRLAKVRYILDAGVEGLKWEVDRFKGSLEGLWLAEIELKHTMQRFDLPVWLGREVSSEGGYTNASLARRGLPMIAVP